MQNEKQIKEVHCLGRLPNLGRCDEVLYQSEGEFFYVRVRENVYLIINEHLDLQRVRCPNCGYQMIWKRAEIYRRPKFKTKY